MTTEFIAVVRKETLQTVRDRRVMFLLIMAPLLQTTLFGVAVDFDVDRVATAVRSSDLSVTRGLLADGTLIAGDSTGDIDTLLDAGDIQAAVLYDNGRAQVVVDGSDPIRAGAAVSAVAGYFSSGSSIRTRIWYNPQLKTRFYMVPGLLGRLLVIVTTIVTAMGLARENETGTLEQLAVTPIHPLVLLAGKMTPFVIIGLLDALLVLTAAAYIFAIPFRGSLFALALGTLFFLCSTLGVGLLISTLSRTQQQSFLGGFLFVLPAALLSGIMTPIHSMPTWLSYATTLNPLRWFAQIVRSILLRGATVVDLWQPLLILLVFGVAILLLATARFTATRQS